MTNSLGTGDRETKRKTLEEIAASFGDKVVAAGEQGEEDPDAKPHSQRVEVVYEG